MIVHPIMTIVIRMQGIQSYNFWVLNEGLVFAYSTGTVEDNHVIAIVNFGPFY